MAVQAQHHPSNVLFLNRSGAQDGKGNDYSLHPYHAGGGGAGGGTFIDETEMLFNHGAASAYRSYTAARFTAPQCCDLGTHIKQQRDEIEQYLRAQGEQLRRTLEEKRQRHYRALVGAAEESLTRRLREKEAEVDKAIRRNAELEARAAQLAAEAQAWQARARAQELTAATLQAQLQQAMARSGCSNAHHPPERNDGATAAGEAEDAESAYIDPDRVEVSAGSNCRSCGKRAASVVLLPCRHLCLCRRCDAAAQACPLCLTFRSSSVEVFFC
nr:BOI-related E3 ubiquitin-protein ligase 1-like [Ipomoea batatas]